MALRIVRYKLHTLILVVREAEATGAGVPSSADDGGVMSGRTVLNASGKRRVKNKVEACRYVLEMWDECL